MRAEVGPSYLFSGDYSCARHRLTGCFSHNATVFTHVRLKGTHTAAIMAIYLFCDPLETNAEPSTGSHEPCGGRHEVILGTLDK